MTVLRMTTTALPQREEPRKRDYPQRLLIAEGRQTLVLALEEVDWMEGGGKSVRVHAGARTFVLRQALATLSTRLDPQHFARIHRSTIVNLTAIVAIEQPGSGAQKLVLGDGSRLALSRRYRRELLERLRVV